MEKREEWFECSGGEQGEKQSFPGLNKTHGFFSLIERNQRDRDSYHQEREEWKQERKFVMHKEWRNERDTKRRPPRALYHPPHQRGRGKRTSQPRKYQLDIEVQPNQWSTITVQCGEEAAIVDQLVKEHGLVLQHKEPLRDIMTEFSQKLL